MHMSQDPTVTAGPGPESAEHLDRADTAPQVYPRQSRALTGSPSRTEVPLLGIRDHSSHRTLVHWLFKQEGKRVSNRGKLRQINVLRLTELGFSPMFASTYVSVLGSTASSASRIFSTGMSSLALLVDSTSFSFRSLPLCRSSCTAIYRRQSPGLSTVPGTLPHVQSQEELAPSQCIHNPGGPSRAC